MEIIIENSGLIIAPETEFEKQYIGNLRDVKFDVFVKCGVSASHVIGLKLIEKSGER